MAVGAVASIVGSSLGVYSQYKQSQVEEKNIGERSSSKRTQGFELLARSEINIGELKQEAEKFKAGQVAAFAASGVDISSNATLTQLEQTNRDVSNQIVLERREASFRATQIFKDADNDVSLMKDIKSARGINMFAGVLSGAGQASSFASKK